MSTKSEGAVASAPVTRAPLDPTDPGCNCAMGGMGRRADCPAHGASRQSAGPHLVPSFDGPEKKALLTEDDTTAPRFECQDCPYKTVAVNLAERHEFAKGHDVWEI